MGMTEKEIRAKLDVLCERINESANPPVAVVWRLGQPVSLLGDGGKLTDDYVLHFSFRQGDSVINGRCVGMARTAKQLDLLTERAKDLLTQKGRLKLAALREIGG